MIALHLVIRGRVQGVGYRYMMADAATGFGVAGWVRNRRDGTVEALVQGDAAAVDRMLEWCRRGPSSAQVDDVEKIPAGRDPKLVDFSLRPTA